MRDSEATPPLEAVSSVGCRGKGKNMLVFPVFGFVLWRRILAERGGNEQKYQRRNKKKPTRGGFRVRAWGAPGLDFIRWA